MINKKIFVLLLLGIINSSNCVIRTLYENTLIHRKENKILMQFTAAPPRDRKDKDNLKRPRNGTRKTRYTNHTNIY